MMNDKAISFILFLILVSQVYYIFFHNPQIYQEHYHILIIIPATVAAYLIVLYGQRKLQHLAKPNVVMSPEEFRRHVDEESTRQVNELTRTEDFRKWEAIKEGRIPVDPISEDKKREQEEILQELDAMEKDIFED